MEKLFKKFSFEWSRMDCFSSLHFPWAWTSGFITNENRKTPRKAQNCLYSFHSMGQILGFILVALSYRQI